MKEDKNKPLDYRWIERHSLKSSAVKEEYLIEVSLPETYSDPSKRFPALYLLDADTSFGMARDTTQWLAFAQEIPETIVVGISYGGSTKEWWSKRSRDYTPWKDEGKVWGEWPLAGGADDFKRFLREELLPLIEEQYRTSPHRTIAGLSLGGLFAVYVLFTEPNLFNGYVISGPALIWNRDQILQVEQAYSTHHDRLEAKVFTAVGSLEEAAIIEPWDRFNKLIQKRAYQGLYWKTHQFEDETHISVWPSVLSRGLKYVFSGDSE